MPKIVFVCLFVSSVLYYFLGQRLLVATLLYWVQHAATLERVTGQSSLLVFGGNAGAILVASGGDADIHVMFSTFTIRGCSAPLLMDD